MDALKYLKEIHRMCESMKECTDCPFYGCGLTFPCKGTAVSAEYKDAEKCISIVEKWSAEHPIETRQSEFLKMFPMAEMNEDVVGILPCAIDSSVRIEWCKKYKVCNKCRKEYWLAEVE